MPIRRMTTSPRRLRPGRAARERAVSRLVKICELSARRGPKSTPNRARSSHSFERADLLDADEEAEGRRALLGRPPEHEASQRLRVCPRLGRHVGFACGREVEQERDGVLQVHVAPAGRLVGEAGGLCGGGEGLLAGEALAVLAQVDDALASRRNYEPPVEGG